MRGLLPVLDLVGFVVVVGLVHVLVDVGVEARFGLQLHTIEVNMIITPITASNMKQISNKILKYHSSPN